MNEKNYNEPTKCSEAKTPELGLIVERFEEELKMMEGNTEAILMKLSTLGINVLEGEQDSAKDIGRNGYLAIFDSILMRMGAYNEMLYSAKIGLTKLVG